MFDTLKLIWSSVWPLIRPVVFMMVQVLTQEILEYATGVVTTLQGSDLTSEQKRQEAFNRIKEYSIVQGKELSTSLINLLIEVLVQKMKSGMVTV